MALSREPRLDKYRYWRETMMGSVLKFCLGLALGLSIVFVFSFSFWPGIVGFLLKVGIAVFAGFTLASLFDRIDGR